MTEFTYDLVRSTQEHLPKLQDAMKRGAQPGDRVHLSAVLSNTHVLHTYYKMVERGGGRLVWRFERDVIV